jgi:hypothetical protein
MYSERISLVFKRLQVVHGGHKRNWCTSHTRTRSSKARRKTA